MNLLVFLLFLFVYFLFFPSAITGITVYKILGIILSFLSICFISIEIIFKKIFYNNLFLLIFLIFLCGLFGSISSGYFNSIYTFKMFQNLILVFVITIIVKKEKDLKAILYGIALGGLTTVITGFIFEKSLGLKRLAGIVGNPNGFGQISTQAFFALIGLSLISNRKLFKIVLFAFAGFCVIGLLYSASRGATAAFILGFSVFIIRKNLKYLSLFILVFITIILFNISFPKIFLDRWNKIMEHKIWYSSNVQTRVGLVKYGWELFKNHPVFGVGFGNTLSKYDFVDINNPRVTHNFVIQSLAEIGVIGTLAYLYIVFNTALIFFRISNKQEPYLPINAISLTFFCLLVSIFIAQLTSGNYINTIWYILFSVAYNMKNSYKIYE